MPRALAAPPPRRDGGFVRAERPPSGPPPLGRLRGAGRLCACWRSGRAGLPCLPLASCGCSPSYLRPPPFPSRPVPRLPVAWSPCLVPSLAVSSLGGFFIRGLAPTQSRLTQGTFSSHHKQSALPASLFCPALSCS